MANQIANEILQEKLMDLNNKLMLELEDKFIQELSEKALEHSGGIFESDYIVSLLILIIHMLNKKGKVKE